MTKTFAHNLCSGSPSGKLAGRYYRISVDTLFHAKGAFGTRPHCRLSNRFHRCLPAASARHLALPHNA
jgi:hypothetical protein